VLTDIDLGYEFVVLKQIKATVEFSGWNSNYMHFKLFRANLRRLTFLIIAAELNKSPIQLPIIKKKRFI